MPKVFIESGMLGGQYAVMFLKEGWEVTDNILEADLVQFTGGEDVTPMMYGEFPHHTTYYNTDRDMYCNNIFLNCLKLGIPMAGICRGGQFLHVVNGGELWQDIDEHAMYGTHHAYLEDSNNTIDVTSTHHQAMRLGKGNTLLKGRTPSATRMDGNDEVTQEDVLFNECVYHEKSKSLCYQPHPEFPNMKDSACRKFYFEQIKTLFGLE